ncbi:hypothetical protein ABLE68_09450 [Nocardioides sp. CN2-186]|uniref:hypothetical protein n=1 Tax=Nocardioides tweenelious TaxID=3156607 RepID=UPI0032B37641
MSTFRVRAGALLVITMLGAALLALPSSTASANPGTKTVYFTMTGTPQVQPKRIFLTANAGPYLKKLTWSGWGSDMAMAEGVYISDCASCSPPERRKATVMFSRPISCGKHVQAYSKGVVTVSKPDQGRHQRTFRIHMGCAPE